MRGVAVGDVDEVGVEVVEVDAGELVDPPAGPRAGRCRR